MTILYFAYGSNMLPARLRARCASARIIGRATAPGFDVQFSKLSKDGSGKATLVRGSECASRGVLFEISQSELGALDRAEGRGMGYERVDDFTVDPLGVGEQVEAVTYIATKLTPQLMPFDWYLALVIAGARHHALGDDYVARLRLIQHLGDANHGRRSRAGALEALQHHGFGDYHHLLMSDG